MLSEDFRTVPYWWEDAPPEDAADPLPETADVLVIGAGFAGLSAAAELARCGLDVTVVDAGPLGGGASTRSGGMVSSAQKLVVSGAVSGVDQGRLARLLAASVASFEHLKALIASHGLDAGLSLSGRYFAAAVPGHYDRLRRQGELLAERTGVTVREIPPERQDEITATGRYHGGILVEDYGGLHPARYHRALRGLARAAGATLRSHAPVLEVTRGPGGHHVARTARGTLRAREILVCTNAYTDASMPYLRRRLLPVASYQIATEPIAPALMAEINPGRRMISDTARQLVYTRPSPDGTRIIFGTRPGAFDMPERVAAARMHRQLVKTWPQLSGVKVTHGWSGKVAMTVDRIAHTGTHDGVAYAVGCNGSGVALMTYLGHQSALKLTGRGDPDFPFESATFPPLPLREATPGLVPILSGWAHLRDGADRRLAAG